MNVHAGMQRPPISLEIQRQVSAEPEVEHLKPDGSSQSEADERCQGMTAALAAATNGYIRHVRTGQPHRELLNTGAARRAEESA